MIVKPAHDQSLGEVDAVIMSLLLNASKSVDFSTALTTNGLQRLRPVVETCLGRVSCFRVMLDKTVDSAAFRRDYAWLAGHSNVQVRQSPTPVPHWLSIDGRDFRLEEDHTTDPSHRSNVVILDCEAPLAAQILTRFEALWAVSTKI
jgi:hypothetical protein